MKNIVRVSAIALLAAGAFTANAHRANASLKTVALNSAIPVPTCPPNDPNCCGMTW